jgi:hypothetical protein
MFLDSGPPGTNKLFSSKTGDEPLVQVADIR